MESGMVQCARYVHDHPFDFIYQGIAACDPQRGIFHGRGRCARPDALLADIPSSLVLLDQFCVIPIIAGDMSKILGAFLFVLVILLANSSSVHAAQICNQCGCGDPAPPVYGGTCCAGEDGGGCGTHSCAAGNVSFCNSAGTGWSCTADPTRCGGGGNPPANTPTPSLTPTPAACAYTNLTIEVSADGASWGASADTIRGANGYTKRFYRIMSGGVSIQNALATAPVTIKWEKTATTGGAPVRVLSTYVTTTTVTSLAHNSDICTWMASGNYFMCETITSERTQNIGDAGDFKFTVSSPRCTDTTATYKITTATQQTNCPVQGVRMEYSADNINWKQYGQYFQSLPPRMCARVVDVATNRVVDRDYLEQRWWKPDVATPSDTNASSATNPNAVTGGWVPWKDNRPVYDTGCWTPTTAQMVGIWTGEARLYGLNTCSSKAKQGIGSATTCSGNTPPIYKSLGDADGDCEVDLIHDFVQFIKENTQLLTSLSADFDGSGRVDAGDFAIWKSGYQTFRAR